MRGGRGPGNGRLGPLSPSRDAKDTLARIYHPIERAAEQIGVSYVDLDGDIAIISRGAGLGMATMDVVDSVSSRRTSSRPAAA